MDLQLAQLHLLKVPEIRARDCRSTAITETKVLPSTRLMPLCRVFASSYGGGRNSFSFIGAKPSDQYPGPQCWSRSSSAGVTPNAPTAHICLAPVFFQRSSGDLNIAPTLHSNCRNGGGTQTAPGLGPLFCSKSGRVVLPQEGKGDRYDLKT